jgi:hypothetical protein
VRARLRDKWAALPRWARWVLALYIAGFAEGTGDHALWMTHGGVHAYASSYPQVPLQAFFVSLIILDPLALLLLALVRREGIWLACGVMVLDITANWAGNWSRIQDRPNGLLLAAPWLITLFGLFVLATATPMLRLTKNRAIPLPQQGGR